MTAQSPVWQTLLAPAASFILLAGLLALVVVNFNHLVGGDATTTGTILAAVPVCFALGIALEVRQSRNRSAREEV